MNRDYEAIKEALPTAVQKLMARLESFAENVDDKGYDPEQAFKLIQDLFAHSVLQHELIGDQVAFATCKAGETYLQESASHHLDEADYSRLASRVNAFLSQYDDCLDNQELAEQVLKSRPDLSPIYCN